MRRTLLVLLLASLTALGGATPAFADDDDDDDDGHHRRNGVLEEVVEILVGEDEGLLESAVVQDLLYDAVVVPLDGLTGAVVGVAGEVELVVCSVRQRLVGGPVC